MTRWHAPCSYQFDRSLQLSAARMCFRRRVLLEPDKVNS